MIFFNNVEEFVLYRKNCLVCRHLLKFKITVWFPKTVGYPLITHSVSEIDISFIEDQIFVNRNKYLLFIISSKTNSIIKADYPYDPNSLILSFEKTCTFCWNNSYTSTKVEFTKDQKNKFIPLHNEMTRIKADSDRFLSITNNYLINSSEIQLINYSAEKIFDIEADFKIPLIKDLSNQEGILTKIKKLLSLI